MSLRNMTYDDVVESINSGKVQLFDISSFVKINKNLRNFQSHQMSISLVNPSSMESFGLQIEESTFHTIKNELSHDLNKRIVSKLFETRKFEYIDFRESGGLMGANPHQDMRRLYDLVMSCGEYTNLITTGMIAASLQDIAQYIPSSDMATNSHGKVYRIGKLGNINIWVDPYMKYNDGRIVLFKDVDINIENTGSMIQSQATFTPRLLIHYDLSFDVGDSKIIFVIDDETSVGFQAFKSLQRDIKIDDILDEGQN